MVRHTNHVGSEQSVGKSSGKSPTQSAEQSAARAAARLARQIAVALGDAGLSLSQYRVMAYLAEGERVASALAGGVSVTRPSVTALMDGLEEKGLIERRRSEGDRRVVKAVLTPRGIKALAKADEAARSRIAMLADHLDESDRKRAVEGLALWHGALNAHLAEAIANR